MHEFSVVLSVIEAAEKAARNANAHCIERIDLEIGELAGIEREAFEYAWPVAVSGTLLESTLRKIHSIKGQAKCRQCNHLFNLNQLYEFCPICESYDKEILKGNELNILSIEIN